MGRLDWESGRFGADYEMLEIERALRGWQSEFGDNILYYKFWGENSQVHDIWDEATGDGRIWHPPSEVEVLHATHIEGDNQDRPEGQYFNDNFYATASFDQLRRLGMTELDLQHTSYLNDRIVYDFRVFRVTRIQVMGQIQQRDPIVAIEGTQVKPDEMLNDSGFEAFANPTFPEEAMSITPTPDPNLKRSDKTPYIESRALKNHLGGVMVNSTNKGEAEVPVRFVEPDMELATADYPGIYLAYAGMTKADDREVRGRTNLQYAPPGYPSDVLVPAEPGNPDSDEVDWGESGFGRLNSPYSVFDHPIPYNLDFNVMVVTRNYQQMFEIVSQLDEINYLPARFGGLQVPEDGTVRTLDLIAGPDIAVTKDESNKRMLRTVYSVRVAAEISLYDLEQFHRVSTVELADIEVMYL